MAENERTNFIWEAIKEDLAEGKACLQTLEEKVKNSHVSKLRFLNMKSYYRISILGILF